MPRNRISTKDWVGKVWIKVSKLDENEYFETIKQLAPLFKEKDFCKYVTGFYISCITTPFEVDPPQGVTVRLIYFTPPKYEQDSQRTIKDFLTNESLDIYHEEKPHVEKVSKDYGGDEQRFRPFLYNYTLICLDLIHSDGIFYRQFFGDNTYNVINPFNIISTRPLYEPEFRKSSTYNNMPKRLQNQFFDDLDYIPRNGAIWLHFLLNIFWL